MSVTVPLAAQRVTEGAATRLKRDAFGEVMLVTVAGERRIRRDTTAASWPLRWFARRLLAREARALAHLDGIAGVPKLLSLDPRHRALERSYIEGRALQEARPTTVAFYRAARRLLALLHRAGVAHNDLAKEPNWIVQADGSPAIVDFQLARVVSKRSHLVRSMMREDLRHLLKHKRTYCPAALTARERAILATKSLWSRVWRQTGKRLYNIVTRRLFRWRDAEGKRRQVS